MKPGALILGAIVSLVLLTAAGVLYMMADSSGDEQYRRSIDLVRQIQQLSTDWSMEVTRVKADPLADFDVLAGFIPRVARVKDDLTRTARLIPDLPERVGNDVDAYVNAVEAKEESIERFKTGYAVVRNSSRYLPLAALNVTQQAQDVGDEDLVRRISTLIRDINLYLPTPTDTAAARLTAELEGLREASVAHPPTLANALANLLSHAEVLVGRQGPTEELFRKATSNEISDLTDQLTSDLEFELGKKALLAKYYDMGILAMLAVLALFWITLGVQQRVWTGALAAPSPAPVAAPAALVAPRLPAGGGAPAVAAAAGPAESEAPPAKPVPPAEPAPTAVEEPPVPAPAGTVAVESSSPTDRNAESLVLHGFVAGCVSDALAQAADQISGRMDYLRQTHRRIQDALENGEVVPDPYDGADLDEEIEAISAIATSVRQEAGGIADLGRRLKSFSSANMPDNDIERSMIDINSCIEEAIEATGAKSAATIARSLGDIPEIFALKSEFLLLLTEIIENSVLAVGELKERKGVIKIDTARKNNEILITVIDNGDGITPERRPSIFKPFSSSRDGAMGIGLALAGHLAKRYEGTIKINSLPGQGTVARITLPAGVPAP